MAEWVEKYLSGCYGWVDNENDMIGTNILTLTRIDGWVIKLNGEIKSTKETYSEAMNYLNAHYGIK